MKQPTAEDWGLLECLASERDDLLDRLKALRHRFGSSCVTDSPVVLIAGCDDTACGALVKHCFGLEALRSSNASGTTPLVITNKATVLPTILASLPRIVSQQLQGQIVILAHWPTAVPASALSQLQEVPNLSLFTLIGRLGQPLSARERKLAATLVDVAATAKVLFVGLSGEDASRDELAELSEYSKIVMQRTGFSGTRMITTGVWLLNAGVADSSLLVSDPLTFATRVTGECLASSIQAAQTQALLGILRDIRATHDVRAQPLPDISEQDEVALTRDFDHYLDLLGSNLVSEIQRWSLDDATTKLCGYARDSIKHWGAYITTEGRWLNHVETLRPGTHKLLLAQVENALTALDVRRTPQPARNQSQPAASSIRHNKALGAVQPIDFLVQSLREFWSQWQGTKMTFERAIQEAKCGATGLAAGLAC